MVKYSVVLAKTFTWIFPWDGMEKPEGTFWPAQQF